MGTNKHSCVFCFLVVPSSLTLILGFTKLFWYFVIHLNTAEPEWTDKRYFEPNYGKFMHQSILNYLTVVHYYKQRLKCKDAGWCTAVWQPCLCNTTREVTTTMCFPCWMCICNVCLSWITKLNQTLCSLCRRSRRPSSQTSSLCCTIVVALCLWSTGQATLQRPLDRVCMPAVRVWNGDGAERSQWCHSLMLQPVCISYSVMYSLCVWGCRKV